MRAPTTNPDGRHSAASEPPLAIFAAGGSVPIQVAEAAIAAGRSVYFIGISGEVDDRVTAFPHTIIKWGHIGRLQKLTAERGVREIVLVGSVARRPDFRNIGFDASTLKLMPRILKLLTGGDDSVLSGIVRMLEDYGLTVRGAHEIAADLVAAPGPLAGPAPTKAQLGDAAVALRAAAAIGELDIGQAAVAVAERALVALEAAEGTDAIVRRVGELRAAGRFKWSGRSGVLAKCAKPGQDLRVDLPTIGPRTVELVADVGLAGIVIEAGHVMIAERPATVAAPPPAPERSSMPARSAPQARRDECAAGRRGAAHGLPDRRRGIRRYPRCRINGSPVGAARRPGEIPGCRRRPHGRGGNCFVVPDGRAGAAWGERRPAAATEALAARGRGGGGRRRCQAGRARPGRCACLQSSRCPASAAGKSHHPDRRLRFADGVGLFPLARAPDGAGRR